MTITREQIEADKALCERATEGPWALDHPRDNVVYLGFDHDDGTVIAKSHGSNDAAFIARARAALPEYIAELEALRARYDILFTLAERIIDTEQHAGQPYSDARLVRGDHIKELRALVRGAK